MIAAVSPYYPAKDPSVGDNSRLAACQTHGIWLWPPKATIKVGSWIACADPESKDGSPLEQYYDTFMVRVQFPQRLRMRLFRYGISQCMCDAVCLCGLTVRRRESPTGSTDTSPRLCCASSIRSISTAMSSSRPATTPSPCR